MKITLLVKTARSVTIEMEDNGTYYCSEAYAIFLNGKPWMSVDTVVTSLYNLKPDKEYLLEVRKKSGEVKGTLSFRTDFEFVTLNVKEFGARGDGQQDDTVFIQAAILSCPRDSRVLIPEGLYRITNIFLKSNVRIELAEKAILVADNERFTHPVLPGMIKSYNESEEYNLGTWEGDPHDMFAGIITGVHVENVVIYGEGCIDGNADFDNWWKDPKKRVGAYRPRSFFINNCKNIVLQGIAIQNSPSWTIHPYFSEDLGFYNVLVENDPHSPNTDGLDPESCRNVKIAGVRFSLGDDCIAVKSGKIYMGRKYKRPSENIHIWQCLMENGHGAVTVGSEMAGGVKNLLVESCLFSRTDRGLRVKTRRGRGKDAILDGIEFRNIKMDHVMTPFVINSFYFCDPDGKTDYVQNRASLPVDERTPEIKKIIFRDIECTNTHVAAGYLSGLPEKKIEQLYMENIAISYAKETKIDVPAMANGIEPCSRQGFIIVNVESFVCRNVSMEGQDGKAFVLENIEHCDMEDGFEV